MKRTSGVGIDDVEEDEETLEFSGMLEYGGRPHLFSGGTRRKTLPRLKSGLMRRKSFFAGDPAKKRMTEAILNDQQAWLGQVGYSLLIFWWL